MEKGEVFDSTLLKNMINALIAEGKRNFAIDLTPLDYIYSDAINVILALNRRILDVSGRLSLLGPSPEVRQILERTGIQNILKIYESETDLVKSSEDIILQTTRYNLADLQSYQQAPPAAPAKPKSEFEDFRSEISTAMPGVQAPEQDMNKGYRPPQPPPQQAYGAKAPFKEEEFEAAYKSFETEQASFAPQPPPPPQMSRPEPFTPPPAVPPRQQPQPFRRPEQDFAPVTEPKPQRRKEPEYVAPRTPEPGAGIDEEFHVDTPKVKAKPREEKRDYEDYARDNGDVEPKRSSLVPALITLLIVVILGAGGYFVFVNFIKGGKKQSVATAPIPQRQAVPQVSTPPAPVVQETAPAVPAAKAVEPVPSKIVEETVDKSPAGKKEKGHAVNAKKEKAAPETARKPAEANVPAGKITITSSPSGATIKADDKVIGTTPYVWAKPTVYGEVTITVSKNGYKDAAKTIEFTGTSVSESFRLEKEEAPAVSRPAPRPVVPDAEPEAAAPAAPAPRPKAAPAPAPEPEAAPAAESPRASAGESATVFIASIPPVADVYMDGKLIGKTNITKLNVTAGSHSMRFVKGTSEKSQDMTFKAGDNPSQLVNLK